MAVRRPEAEDLRRIARDFHFTIPDERGSAPRAEENPLGAWAWRVRIEGAAAGPLAGRTIAIKDNVAVAGVPMHNGTALLDGYVPDEDATVVERVLDAGATILGKAVCESLCFSGGSHTADSGPVRNFYDPARSAGGSSSGSAALVASGVVDLAIGGDQGGSVRIPSCWSGIYGLKPTWGLVPTLARVATAAYDVALADHDLLVMPTLPLKATPIPAADAPLEEQVARALEMIPNTAPFDVTGHPAMNVPCAMSAGLPVGMMLVGRHDDEQSILRGAHAFETEVWSPPAP